MLRKLQGQQESELFSWKRNFIICPFGELGLLTKNILNNQYSIREVAIADNILSRYNDNLCDVDSLEEYQNDDVIILLTSDNNIVKKGIYDIFGTDKVKCLIEKRPERSNVGRFSYGPITNQVEEIESIGSFCSFGPGSRVCFNHLMGMVTTHEFLFASTNCRELSGIQKYKWDAINKRTVIGNDVWFGENVIVLNGARIGNGVIAGAGSIITKDVPDYAIVVGNPARIIKFRFSKEQIDKLNMIAWWNWPIEKIKACYDDFLDVKTFIGKHYKEG